MKTLKVHFIGALEGDQKYYGQIVDYVEKIGYKIVTKHSVTRRPNEVEKETFDESKQYSINMLKWIKKSDIVLVEATVSNFGAGYEIAASLKLGRPVVVIYQKNGHNIPYVLMGNEEQKLFVLEYTVNNMHTVVKDYLSEAEKFTQERFTLILPALIIKQLDRVSESGITRSEYIRRLIAKDIHI